MNSDDIERLRHEVASAAKAVSKALQPFHEQLEGFLAQCEPVSEAQRVIAVVVETALRQAQDTQQRLAEVMAPVMRQFHKVQIDLAPLYERIGRAFQELPERQRHALEVLARDGWYSDPELSFAELFEVTGLLEGSEIEKARDTLCQHLDSRLDTIETDLTKRFPERARIISAALRAHRSGEYALSVPVFLAQADGICIQLAGVQLYSRRDGAPQLAGYLRLEETISLRASLLYPLAHSMPISAGQKERTTFTDLLNRHAVVHGEAVDYDTRINSSRALSLLVYVSWVLEEVLNREAP